MKVVITDVSWSNAKCGGYRNEAIRCKIQYLSLIKVENWLDLTCMTGGLRKTFSRNASLHEEDTSFLSPKGQLKQREGMFGTNLTMG